MGEYWESFNHQIAPYLGALCFGAVIGWALRFVLAFAKEITVGSLGVIISSLCGAAITAIFDIRAGLFGYYCVGLALGFFTHVLLTDVDSRTGNVVYHKYNGDRTRKESSAAAARNDI